ncbi:MAG TPA: hypothetical protein VME23_11825 [Terracidiphilus sp.]|nr:hypothetical protein [Terracidiphilus sp.]
MSLTRAMCLLVAGAFFGSIPPAAGTESNRQVHAMWVWKSPVVLAQPNAAQKLRDFCRSNTINEIYISVNGSMDANGQSRLAHLIGVLHAAKIRIDALFSSTDADEGGAHLEKLLGEVNAVGGFNQKHPEQRFDGVHLDIEPQQRPENKGPSNLAFLPGLVNAYTQVRKVAANSSLEVNADIQTKLLKGSREQRRMLLTSLSGITLMLYELSSPDDGRSANEKAAKLKSESQKYLQMAGEGLDALQLASISIGLRTPDYGDLMPQMLQVLDEANESNAMYGGWSWHSYNDALGQ